MRGSPRHSRRRTVSLQLQRPPETGWPSIGLSDWWGRSQWAGWQPRPSDRTARRWTLRPRVRRHRRSAPCSWAAAWWSAPSAPRPCSRPATSYSMAGHRSQPNLLTTAHSGTADDKDPSIGQKGSARHDAMLEHAGGGGPLVCGGVIQMGRLAWPDVSDRRLLAGHWPSWITQLDVCDLRGRTLDTVRPGASLFSYSQVDRRRQPGGLRWRRVATGQSES